MWVPLVPPATVCILDSLKRKLSQSAEPFWGYCSCYRDVGVALSLFTALVKRCSSWHTIMLTHAVHWRKNERENLHWNSMLRETTMTNSNPISRSPGKTTDRVGFNTECRRRTATDSLHCSWFEQINSTSSLHWPAPPLALIKSAKVPNC